MCVYVFMCICIYIYVGVCVCIYLYMSAYAHIHLNTHQNKDKYNYMSLYAHHMYTRQPTTPPPLSQQVKRRLQRLRAACEAMGVADSMLLPRDQWVTEEEQGEIDRATAALDKEKRDDADLGVEEGEGEEGVVEEARRGLLKGRRWR